MYTLRHQFSHLLSQTFYHCSTCLTLAASLTLTLLTPCKYQPHIPMLFINKPKLAQVMPNVPTVMLHHDLQFNQYTNMATPSFTKISHITTLFGLHDDKSKKDLDVYTSYSLTSHPLHQQMITCLGVTGFGHQVHQVNLSRLSSRNVFFWSWLPKA